MKLREFFKSPTHCAQDDAGVAAWLLEVIEMQFQNIRARQSNGAWQRRVLASLCMAALGCFGVIASATDAEARAQDLQIKKIESLKVTRERGSTLKQAKPKKAKKNAPVVWPCAASKDDGTARITNKHGTETLLSSGEYVEACKFFADATITSVVAKRSGRVIVKFTVMDKDGNPVVGVPSVSANIAKLMPASGDESFNQWVPYIYRTETVADGSFPNPAGTTVEQGYRESNGRLTDYRNGTYKYKFATNIAKVMTPVTGTRITYDRSLPHRVSIMLGGHSGPTATAVFDFVPDGSAVSDSRNIVQTQNCYACHGENEFHGHGGDRLTVENCVTCHNPGGIDAQGGETLDMKVMIHKIHAGGELFSIPGADGIVWDDPGTAVDESADNGEYAIWGYRDSKHEWWKAEFPAVIENCTKCHQGTGENVDNWKEVPSRAACSSCHDDVDFASGVNHAGGPQSSDASCGFCHAPEGPGYPPSVADAHDWTTKDQRNIPEFDIDLTVSTPGNGKFFVAGESPVVSIVINDDGMPIDHTTAVKDTDGREGCASSSACPPADGKFDHIYLMVHGPRAERAPVLSTAARADIVSGSAGPFDLSTAVSLDLRVDNEVDVSVDVDPGAFADSLSATSEEIVDWLNANADFADAAIAYLEGGNVAIRSRNIGKFFALQLETSDVNTIVFGGDTSIYVPGGFYPSNDVAMMADPADDDPKAEWFVDGIDYNLDPVDDLRPGTYIASVEITDRGRINDSNYKTPSVAKALFQVKQAEEELAPAGNCGRCHEGPNGTGWVLDYPRHNKIFDNTAVDQCGGCHDYQNQNATGEWSGARPISKRVHAVHHGSELNYPVATVDHADTVPGRDWDIEFPQDIRNCETCHPAGTTSGSWKTEPSRLPCSGCHDSDAATAHIELMTYDPSPADPWNGDEEESCKVCH